MVTLIDELPSASVVNLAPKEGAGRRRERKGS
jgi:hypothetical protein